MQPTLTSPTIAVTVDNASYLANSSPSHGHRIQVIRRDGSTTPLNISKIRAVVDWACMGLEVNSIALEAGLTTRLREGISTRE
ncbi:MAG: ATP cone domain-containing protein, partial [Synechocystis sp.]